MDWWVNGWLRGFLGPRGLSMKKDVAHEGAGCLAPAAGKTGVRRRHRD